MKLNHIITSMVLNSYCFMLVLVCKEEITTLKIIIQVQQTTETETQP